MTKQSFHKKRILFFGDSLTQYGKLPEGYISLLTEYLKSNNLSDQIELVGAGVGGDKVYDLYLRLESDVLNQHPNIVVILIGINDIWHKSSGIGTDSIKFKRFYEAIIDKIQTYNIELFLATPTLIGELKNLQNTQDFDLEMYAQIIRDLATTKNCKLIDLRKIFINYIQQHNTNNNLLGVLTTDKVHLNNQGNQLVAENFKSIFSI